MAATTVRVDETTKRGLDRLLGLVQSETGARITYTELLTRLLGVARRHQGELLQAGETGWRPPSPAQIQRLLGRVRDWGVRTDSSRVDDELYGGSPHE